MGIITLHSRFFKFCAKHWIWIIFLLTSFLRFFDLNWDGVYKLHPDELNISIAIHNMEENPDFNPDFFAYGTLPIGLIFTIKQFFLSFFEISLNDYLVGRFISATLSSLSILIFYKWIKLFAKKIYPKNEQLFLFISVFILAFSPAVIQSAHFMTFESILIFEYLLFSLAATNYLIKKSKLYLFLVGVITGVAIATKITSFFLLPIFVLIIFLSYYKKLNQKKSFLITVHHLAYFIFISILTASVLSPFSIMNWNKFLDIIKYESSVADGDLRVFYTQQFFNTTPVIFQTRSVLDFLLGGFVWLFFTILGFYYFARNSKRYYLYIPFVFLLLGWLPTSFLFVKWIRYSVYFTPFFAIFAAVGMMGVLRNYIKIRNLLLVSTFLISLINLWMFYRVYTAEDTRITTAKWAEHHIPQNSNILSESYDLSIIPFNNKFMDSITLFDFYNLNDIAASKFLSNQLENTEYIISPSQRVWGNLNHQKGDLYKINYYNSLNDSRLGFELVYTSKVDTDFLIFGYDQKRLEETFSVFDHPEVRIYKKIGHKSSEDYLKIITAK